MKKSVKTKISNEIETPLIVSIYIKNLLRIYYE